MGSSDPPVRDPMAYAIRQLCDIARPPGGIVNYLTGLAGKRRRWRMSSLILTPDYWLLRSARALSGYIRLHPGTSGQ